MKDHLPTTDHAHPSFPTFKGSHCRFRCHEAARRPSWSLRVHLWLSQEVWQCGGLPHPTGSASPSRLKFANCLTIPFNTGNYRQTNLSPSHSQLKFLLSICLNDSSDLFNFNHGVFFPYKIWIQITLSIYDFEVTNQEWGYSSCDITWATAFNPSLQLGVENELKRFWFSCDWGKLWTIPGISRTALGRILAVVPDC